MQTLSNYDPKLFEGAASYYAEYRPKYPMALFYKLSKLFQLNGQGRLLDLGTGAGLIAIPIHKLFAEVVAVDPDPEMLREAQQQQATKHSASNIIWVQQRAESITPDWGTFQLVTIGRAFHWMQRESVLVQCYDLLSDNGGVAILDIHEDPWKSDFPWKQGAIAVVKKWLGEQRRAGQGVWVDPDPSHVEILARSPFAHQEFYKVEFEQSWTVEGFIGYLYSTAFCLRSFLGDQVEQFEQEVRETLLAIAPSGRLKERITASALVAWKQQ